MTWISCLCYLLRQQRSSPLVVASPRQNHSSCYTRWSAKKHSIPLTICQINNRVTIWKLFKELHTWPTNCAQQVFNYTGRCLGMPPHLLITSNKCSETSPYAAIIFRNPIFIYAICFGRNFRNVYPQINGKESVHVFSEARYVCNPPKLRLFSNFSDSSPCAVFGLGL